MIGRRVTFAAGLALASIALPVRAGLLSSDDSVHLWYGTAFREPFNPNDVTKFVITFTHVDQYKWGGNFLNVDMYYSHATSGDIVHGLNSVSDVGSVEGAVVGAVVGTVVGAGGAGSSFCCVPSSNRTTTRVTSRA